MPWALLGILTAVAIAVNASKKRHRGPQPPALADTAPRTSPETMADATDASEALDELADETEPEEMPTPEEAAEAVRDGDPTQEDYAVLAVEAEHQGMHDEAAQLRERAESAPSTNEVVEAEQAAEDMAAQQGATPDDNEDPPANPQVPPENDPANPAPDFTPPDGFDPHLARSLAGQVNDNIWGRKYSYDRNLLKRFQRAAGIGVDGVYGPASRAALMYYTGPNDTPPHRVLFRGAGGSTADVEYPEALRYWARRNGYNSATSGRSSRRRRRRKRRRKWLKKFGKSLIPGGALTHTIMAARKVKKRRAKKRKKHGKGRTIHARRR